MSDWDEMTGLMEKALAAPESPEFDEEDYFEDPVRTVMYTLDISTGGPWVFVEIEVDPHTGGAMYMWLNVNWNGSTRRRVLNTNERLWEAAEIRLDEYRSRN